MIAYGHQPHVAQEGAFAAAVGHDAPVLHYFPGRARAEPIRLALAYLHIEWFEPPIEGILPLYRRQLDGYPFRQLPRYIDGDVDLVEFGAIIRHIARRHRMYGANDRQASVVDQVVEAADDLRLRFRLVYVDKGLAAEAVEEYKHTVLADAADVVHLSEFKGPLLAGLELLAQAITGDRPWVAGTEALTIADIVVFNLVDLHLEVPALADTVRSRFPKLTAHHGVVASQPGIARYLNSANRHADVFPIKWMI